MIVERDFFRKKTNPATDVHLLRGLNDAKDHEHWTVKRGDCLISVGLLYESNSSKKLKQFIAIRAFLSLTECTNSL